MLLAKSLTLLLILLWLFHLLNASYGVNMYASSASHPEMLTKLKGTQATEYKRKPHCVMSQVLSATSTNGNKICSL